MDRIDAFLFGILTGAVVFVIIWVILNLTYTPITPMDVYQGKTTLKYEVVDGVKVDSVVVWKEELKK